MDDINDNSSKQGKHSTTICCLQADSHTASSANIHEIGSRPFTSTELVKLARPSLTHAQCQAWVHRLLDQPPFAKSMENAVTDQDYEEMGDVMEAYENMLKTRTRARVELATPTLKFNDNSFLGNKFYRCECKGIPSLIKVLDAGGETTGYELVVHPSIIQKNYLVEFTLIAVERSVGDLGREGSCKTTSVIMPLYPNTYAISPLSLMVVPRIIAQMLKALRTLHNSQLAHMDVKPSNIFRNMQGDSFLGDFGSVTKLGCLASSTTDAFIPTDFHSANYRASELHDYWMLAITVADKYFERRAGKKSRNQGLTAVQVIKSLMQLRESLVDEKLDVKPMEELLVHLYSDTRVDSTSLQSFCSVAAASLPSSMTDSVTDIAQSSSQFRVRDSKMRLEYRHARFNKIPQQFNATPKVQLLNPSQYSLSGFESAEPTAVAVSSVQGDQGSTSCCGVRSCDRSKRLSRIQKLMSATPTGSSILEDQSFLHC